MKEEQGKVDLMQKVRLALTVGRDQEACAGARPATEMEFVFGVATEGLVPFEQDLARHRVGDRFFVHITPERLPAYFRHLLPARLLLPVEWRSFYLGVEVVAAAPAPPREVVRALAMIANCGDGGDCCGHH